MVACLFALMLVQPVHAQEIPRVLTVQDAMRLAVERNPLIAAAESGSEASEAALEAQRARRLPTLSTGASARIQQSLARPVTVPGGTIRSGGGIIETSEIALSLQHSFVQSGRSEAIAAADARLDISRASLEDSRRALTRNVAATYYAIMAGQELAEVAQQAVSSAELTLELVDARIEAGVAAPAERLTVEADLARARYEALAAENAVWQSLAELRAQLALPPDEQPLLRGELDEVPPVAGLDYWVDRGLLERPDLEADAHRVRVAELALQQQRIQAGLSYNLIGQADYGRYTGTTGETWQVAAGISFPLFDRVSGAGVAEAQASLEQTREFLEDARLAVTREISQAWYNLRDARERVVSAELAQDAAASSLEVSRARYGEGLVTIIEVTDAELQWRRAAATLVQARYDRVVSYYRLLAAGGHSLLEHEVEETRGTDQSDTVVPE